MRTLLAAVTAFMLFATPVVAGDFENGVTALKAGDHQKAFDLFRSTAEQGTRARSTWLAICTQECQTSTPMGWIELIS